MDGRSIIGVWENSSGKGQRKLDNRPCVFSQKKNIFFYFFSLGVGGGFRDKKKFFFENGIYLAKIPTKSIFNSGKR